ncbi:MFS transporter [Streptomyces sp. TS71-3]|nr:MFS transporter [Streptomyces sp. TS71-3]GHJ38546.1 MFS transporter [Streptomyces sp. TS71-3]
MAVEETRTSPPPAGLATPPDVPHRASAPPAWLIRLLIVGMVLAALNLRPAVTSLGALLEDVRDDLGMNGSIAGLLTSMPPFCFAVFGIMAPRLARRFGPAAVVCGGMVAITAGLALRPLAGGTASFLAGTALALMGVAFGNVLMPVIVKRWFPDRVGPMTGLYSMALSLGTSLAAALTVPFTHALGGEWRAGLGTWAVLGGIAALAWIPLARRRDGGPADQGDTRVEEPGEAGASAQEPGLAAREAGAPAQANAGVDGTGAGGGLRIARSRIAWLLAVFFGLQASGAYITMGWLPQIFRDAGVSAGTAGLLVAFTMVIGVPLAFVIPRAAARMPHQGPIVVVLGVCGLAGCAGLYLAPAAGAVAWAGLLGVSNCAFPLALTMVGMRARTGAGVAQLSAFAQSVGYLISIPGPLLVGVLYQHSGGWGLPIALMTGLLVPQVLVGVLAGRDRTIEAERATAGTA